jgi:hypothetical protein
MKSNSFRSLVTTFALTGGLLLGDSARAAVSSIINSPTGSFASIQFIDTTSLNPSLNPGTTSINQNVTPWGGVPPINNTLSLTTDPVTFDFAQGDITADVLLGNYSLTLNNVVLNQIAGNTGFADLIFQFSVEFQLDAFGLPSQATVFPNFAVNGTVQSSSGSFAAVKGIIDYYGVNTAGTYGVLETVNYNSLFNTPGNFSAIVPGIPVNGTTPTLVGGTTLTLVGYFDFTVDPANINVETVPVPEPGTGLLLGLAAVSGLLWRRFARPIAVS